MSRPIPKTRFLLAAAAILVSPLAVAWTPYGYGPYDPGFYGGYPGAAPSEQLPAANAETGAGDSDSPPPDDRTGGAAAPWGYPYGPWTPGGPYGEPVPETTPPEQGYLGFGPWSGSGWGYPGGGYPDWADPGFRQPAGFHISRGISDDACTLDIGLIGMTPHEVQIRTAGQRLLISRESSQQQVQKEDLDDGQGYVRRFSYSSGTTSRRLSVPGDADLSAMSRADREGSIHIRIPRGSR